MVLAVRKIFNKSKPTGSLPPNPREARHFLPPQHSTYCPVTIGAIVLCVALAILSKLGSNPDVVRWGLMSNVVFHFGQPSTFLPEVFQRGQVWRLISPIFFHIGFFHLLFNLLLFRELGMLLERRYGSLRYLGLFLVLALVSCMTQYLFVGPFFFGMSGVIFGLFGYTWVQGRLNPAGFGFVLSNQTVAVLMIWFVLCFTNIFGPIANAAHTGGLVLGMLISWIVAKKSDRKFLERRRQFQAAFTSAMEPLHRCHICGITEQTSPNTDFRVSSLDGEEYCMAHLPPIKNG